MTRQKLPTVPESVRHEPEVIGSELPPVEDYLIEIDAASAGALASKAAAVSIPNRSTWALFIFFSASFGYGLGFVFAWLLADGEINVDLGALKEIYIILRSLRQ